MPAEFLAFGCHSINDVLIVQFGQDLLSYYIRTNASRFSCVIVLRRRVLYLFRAENDCSHATCDTGRVSK